MKVRDLILELEDVDPDVEVEVAVPLRGLDVEMVLSELMVILQNGTLQIFATE